MTNIQFPHPQVFKSLTPKAYEELFRRTYASLDDIISSYEKLIGDQSEGFLERALNFVLCPARMGSHKWEEPSFNRLGDAWLVYDRKMIVHVLDEPSIALMDHILPNSKKNKPNLFINREFGLDEVFTAAQIKEYFNVERSTLGQWEQFGMPSVGLAPLKNEKLADGKNSYQYCDLEPFLTVWRKAQADKAQRSLRKAP